MALSNLSIASIIIAIVSLAVGVAYAQGYLDPIIQAIMVHLFKAKAKAEAAALQAKGVDFAEDQLKGNQQAQEVSKATGIDGFSDLKEKNPFNNQAGNADIDDKVSDLKSKNPFN